MPQRKAAKVGYIHTQMGKGTEVMCLSMKKNIKLNTLPSSTLSDYNS